MNGVQLAGSTWLMPRAMNRPTTASLMTTMMSLTRELWVMPFMLIKVMIQMMATALKARVYSKIKSQPITQAQNSPKAT